MSWYNDGNWTDLPWEDMATILHQLTTAVHERQVGTGRVPRVWSHVGTATPAVADFEGLTLDETHDVIREIWEDTLDLYTDYQCPEDPGAWETFFIEPAPPGQGNPQPLDGEQIIRDSILHDEHALEAPLWEDAPALLEPVEFGGAAIEPWVDFRATGRRSSPNAGTWYSDFPIEMIHQLGYTAEGVPFTIVPYTGGKLYSFSCHAYSGGAAVQRYTSEAFDYAPGACTGMLSVVMSMRQRPPDATESAEILPGSLGTVAWLGYEQPVYWGTSVVASIVWEGGSRSGMALHSDGSFVGGSGDAIPEVLEDDDPIPCEVTFRVTLTITKTKWDYLWVRSYYERPKRVQQGWFLERIRRALEPAQWIQIVAFPSLDGGAGTEVVKHEDGYVEERECHDIYHTAFNGTASISHEWRATFRMESILDRRQAQRKPYYDPMEYGDWGAVYYRTPDSSPWVNDDGEDLLTHRPFTEGMVEKLTDHHLRIWVDATRDDDADAPLWGVDAPDADFSVRWNRAYTTPLNLSVPEYNGTLSYNLALSGQILRQNWVGFPATNPDAPSMLSTPCINGWAGNGWSYSRGGISRKYWIPSQIRMFARIELTYG